MAYGYARATGKPGVAITLLYGPGLFARDDGHGAAKRSVPSVLVLSSCLDETRGTQGAVAQIERPRRRGQKPSAMVPKSGVDEPRLFS